MRKCNKKHRKNKCYKRKVRYNCAKACSLCHVPRQVLDRSDRG